MPYKNRVVQHNMIKWIVVKKKLILLFIYLFVFVLHYNILFLTDLSPPVELPSLYPQSLELGLIGLL